MAKTQYLEVSLDGGETFVRLDTLRFRTAGTGDDLVTLVGTLDAEKITLQDGPYNDPSTWHFSSL